RFSGLHNLAHLLGQAALAGGEFLRTPAKLFLQCFADLLSLEESGVTGADSFSVLSYTLAQLQQSGRFCCEPLRLTSVTFRLSGEFGGTPIQVRLLACQGTLGLTKLREFRI